jgi:molybdopterin molybdotransferase
MEPLMSIHQLRVSETENFHGQEKRKERPDFERRLLDYDEALAVCLGSVEEKIPAEIVRLEEGLGRVLRKDMESEVFVPPFRRSMMDGYAVRKEDVRWASPAKPVKLRMKGEIPAGFKSDRALFPGETFRIMTGAPVPDGADAVIRLENTSCWDGETVIFFDSAGENDYIVPMGQDLSPGMVTARAGETVTPAMVGVLAASGVSRIPVSKILKVGIISTGSELSTAGSKVCDGKIYDINSHSLFALAKAAGASPVNMGVVRDKTRDLYDKIAAAGDMDVLLLSGGVSVGDYDIVHETLMEAGVTEIFWRVKVKPGKPLFFGKKGKTLVFGLPGNPVSSLVNFNLFVRPVLDKLSGKTSWGLRKGSARIIGNLILAPGRRKFLRGKISEIDASLCVEIIAEQRSGIFSPMMRADVLLEVAEETRALKEGDIVNVYYL